MSEDVTRRRDVDVALSPRTYARGDDDDDPRCLIAPSPVAPGSIAPRPDWDACLMVVHARSGKLPGRCYELVNPTIIGRSPSADIVVEDTLVSRQHARFERADDGWRVTDRGSTNGTFCNGAPITEVALAHGDRLGIGCTIFKLLSDGDLPAGYAEEASRMAISDGLTQAMNRRRFYDLLDEEVLPRGRGAAIVSFDVDHLGVINAENGVMAGDLALVEIARMAEALLGPGQLLAHFGAGRFAVLLPDGARDEAAALAETLRGAVSDHLFVHDDEEIHMTISAGAAAITAEDRSAYEVLTRVNRLLFDAKRGGRDRVQFGA